MTDEDIVRLYEKANGWSPEGWDKTVSELSRFAKLVATAEREACAAILDANAEKCVHGGMVFDVLLSNAEAIRQREQR